MCLVQILMLLFSWVIPLFSFMSSLCFTIRSLLSYTCFANKKKNKTFSGVAFRFLVGIICTTNFADFYVSCFVIYAFDVKR